MSNEAFMLEFNALRKGRTDLELAQILHASIPTVRRWAAGETVPTPMIQAAILMALRR